MSRIRLLLVSMLIVLSGCSTMRPEDFAGTTPRFLPEVYFAGHTRAWGFFQDRFGKIRRQFVVDIDGTFEGDVLTMEEHFAYADGEKQTRVWKIRKLDDTHYEGTAGDVIGVAKGTAIGQAMNWNYQFDLPLGEGSTLRATFDDWMLQQDPEVMINRTTVSKFGLTLGEVVIFFRREGGKAASAGVGEPAPEPAQKAAE